MSNTDTVTSRFHILHLEVVHGNINTIYLFCFLSY